MERPYFEAMATLRYGLLTSKGLSNAVKAEISLREIECSISAHYPLRNQELLLVEGSASLAAQLRSLRTVEDLFVIAALPARIPQRKLQLRLVDAASRQQILEALALKEPSNNRKATSGFAVFVKQDHDYPLHRKTIAGALIGEVEGTFRRWKYRDPAEIELWIFLSKGLLLWGVRLTSIEFRQRTYRADERSGSLQPVVAAALAVLSKPRLDEVILDPMCGSGTLLIERQMFPGNAESHGADVDKAAIDLAKKNSGKANVSIKLTCADSTQADFGTHLEGRVDTVLCNLPYGRQFAKESDLYDRSLARWRALLRERGGKMVLLTPLASELTRAAHVHQLSCTRLLSCNVKGIAAGIFLLERVAPRVSEARNARGSKRNPRK